MPAARRATSAGAIPRAAGKGLPAATLRRAGTAPHTQISLTKCFPLRLGKFILNRTSPRPNHFLICANQRNLRTKTRAHLLVVRRFRRFDQIKRFGLIFCRTNLSFLRPWYLSGRTCVYRPAQGRRGRRVRQPRPACRHALCACILASVHSRFHQQHRTPSYSSYLLGANIPVTFLRHSAGPAAPPRHGRSSRRIHGGLITPADFCRRCRRSAAY